MCHLGPGGLRDYAPLITRLDRWAKQPQWGRDKISIGGLLYRAGRHQECITQLLSSINDYADGWLYLAMAQQRLENRKEARQDLEKGRQAIVSTTNGGWYFDLQFSLQLREARALIDPMAPLPDKTIAPTSNKTDNK